MPAREVARALAKARRYWESRKDRKKVEVLFAHLKRILKLPVTDGMGHLFRSAYRSDPFRL
jgi:hypothetical protein